MRWSDFIRDRYIAIITHILGMMGLSLLLRGAGNSVDFVILILGIWFAILSISYILNYIQRRNYYKELDEILEGLEQKYLLSDLMKRPTRLEDQLHYSILKASHKSMLENLKKKEEERGEYHEYIEQWVHEVKTPLAAIKLICENNKDQVTNRIKKEIAKTEDAVEQVLFYARSEDVEKDYLIKETSLKECVYEVVKRNKTTFIEKKIAIEIEEIDRAVYADRKWLVFILNQIMVNALKYSETRIRVYSRVEKNNVVLHIEDDGIGILESEIPRIFDKGFTGTNGRSHNKSTGFGLYLCKKLCDKLEIEMNVQSVLHKYTMISLSFPHGRLHV